VIDILFVFLLKNNDDDKNKKIKNKKVGAFYLFYVFFVLVILQLCNYHFTILLFMIKYSKDKWSPLSC
jgi:hypothetical protein